MPLHLMMRKLSFIQQISQRKYGYKDYSMKFIKLL